MTPPSPSPRRKWLRRFAAGLAALMLLAVAARAAFFKAPSSRRSRCPTARCSTCTATSLAWVWATAGALSRQLCGTVGSLTSLRAFGVTRAEVEAKGDSWLAQRVSEQIAESRHVGAAIILAMDGVVDAQGQLDRTPQVYVPNEHVAAACARHTNLLFGASVNPTAPDALERLVWARDHGAVVVKWIPSIMAIDPADPKLEPFYRKLVELDLPLLTHAGQERSFTHARRTL